MYEIYELGLKDPYPTIKKMSEFKEYMMRKILTSVEKLDLPENGSNEM